jgi:YHS domain-containing protein
MQIIERETVGKFEYQGTVYQFCSLFCRAAFIHEPEKYLPRRKDVDTKRRVPAKE